MHAFTDAQSTLFVQVFKDETLLLSTFSHNHVMRATAWSTVFTFDASDPENCSIEARVPVEDLRVDETAMRERLAQRNAELCVCLRNFWPPRDLKAPQPSSIS